MHAFWGQVINVLKAQLEKALQYYFVTPDHTAAGGLKTDVENAVKAGVTMVHYRNTVFLSRFFNDVFEIRNLLKCNHIPFVIEDNILLAKALDADGVVLDVGGSDIHTAKSILGQSAIVGVWASSVSMIRSFDVSGCDFCLICPAERNKTRAEQRSLVSPAELLNLSKDKNIPVLVTGDITDMDWKSCLDSGGAGIVVTHEMVSRKKMPGQDGSRGTASRSLERSWHNEFDLIEQLLKAGPKSNKDIDPRVIVPAGDDACLLNSLQHPVISTDSHVEGVHFRLEWQTPEEIGQKAVTVTLSDLAASYAKPVSLFINLGLPSYISSKTVEAVYNGVGAALEHYRCTLGGGNVSANSRLSLELFAIGEGRNIFPLRANALPGYGLYCTGPLGLARAGLDALYRKTSGHDDVVSRFKYPVARFDAAEVLASFGIDCVMDISDGLKGDAGHMAKASEITIEFSVTPENIAPRLKAYCRIYGLNACEMAISGGEDYELLFACRPEIYEKVEKELNGVWQVGTCLPFNGDYIQNSPSINSFQHGK